MVLCSCGQFTDENTTLCPRCEALHVLGLGMEALENEIRSAYRLLSKAWQPENFADDPKLKESAEAKLNDIQTAFDFLTTTSSDRTLREQRPVYLSAKLAAAAALPTVVSDAHTAADGMAAFAAPAILEAAPVSAPLPSAAPASEPQTPQNLWRRFKVPIIAGATIAVLLIGLFLWTAFRANGPAGDQSASVRKKPMNPLVALLADVLNTIDPPPSTSAAQTSELPSQSSTFSGQNSTPDASAPAGTQARTGAKGQQPGTTHAAPADVQAGMAKLKPYITVGSTREEAIALEGTPTASTESKLVYGRSELTLNNGVIVGWHIEPGSPVRVKLWPRAFVDPALDFFSAGSTRDEVLKIQGTPSTLAEDRFEYGGAIVYFSNNRVVRWKSDPASVTLWAR
jgi:hypothetical protein